MHVDLSGPAERPMRPICPCGELCSLERRRGRHLGRLHDAVDYAGPLVYGVAAWLAACRMTWLLRTIKSTDDWNPHSELDVVA